MEFKKTKKAAGLISYLILPAIIAAVWFYTTEKEIFSAAILPSIQTVTKSFMSQMKSGQLIEDVAVSLSRVIKGFALASILGIIFGICMGISDKFNRFFTLTFTGIRQIPMLAWMPLIILWFGIGEASKIVIIVIGAFFPVLVNTMSGIREIPKSFLEVGRIFQLSRWDTLRKIYLPAAIPSIFIGLRLAIGFAWMIVVAAELISASSGVGYRINDARSLMQPEVVIVGIFVIGFIGILMDQVLTRIAKLSTPWTNSRG